MLDTNKLIEYYKMKKQIDYTSVCFGAMFLLIVVASTVTAVSWMMDVIGIHLTELLNIDTDERYEDEKRI